MEICGGQTHSIMQHGLHQLLPEEIHLLHGPGCPVCVTPIEKIDQAIAIAMQAKDTKILGHFKLVLEDGERIDGIDVTTDRIAELRDKGRNPMWFVEEQWMATNYGVKSDQPLTPAPARSDVTEQPTPKSDVLTLYAERCCLKIA